MIWSLFPPVSARILALVQSLEPARLAGATFTPGAAAELARDLAELAGDTRAIEAAAVETEAASRRLFALAGAVEKHAATGFVLPRPEALVLSQALSNLVALVMVLERDIRAMAQAPLPAEQPSWPVDPASLAPKSLRQATDDLEGRRARWLASQRQAIDVGLL